MAPSGAGGVTLVELVIALALSGLVAAAVFRAMLDSQRVYRWQAERLELNGNLRAVVTILPGELRQLSANDPAGSDIIAMAESLIRYKATRSLYVTCQPAAPGGTLSLEPVYFGQRALDPERDSVLVLVGAEWLRASAVSASQGRACPGGAASLDVTLAPRLKTGEVVPRGTPVRSFEVQEVREYADATGDRWLGARRWHKVTGWSVPQPLAGPLAARGFRLAYFDAAGAPAAAPDEVARIDLTVIGRSARRVRTPAGAKGFLLDTLVTSVALRNNQ